jgi:acetyl-CoA carboxylase biotin carboxyl carrier protein
MNISEIQDLIKFIAKAGVTEVEIEKKDFKLTIRSEMPRRRGRGELDAVVQPRAVQSIPGAPITQVAVPGAVTAVPVAPPAPVVPAAAPAASEPEEDKYITVKSPMIGTLYRRAAPDKDTFVEVGDIIKPGDVLCVIEAMKLFNEIESEVSGRIVKILVDDSTPIEYDQPLFLVDPS